MSTPPRPPAVPWLLRVPPFRRYGVALDRAARRQEAQQAKLEALRAQHARDREAFAERIQDLKGRQLSADVLQHLLAPRLAALRASSRGAAEAAAAEAAFAGRSPTYAAARAAAGLSAGAGVSRVTIEGLAWAVPDDGRAEGSLSDRVLRLGWLPLQQILAAREVAGGHTMIDVGANIGTTSITRVVLGDVQRVYAAEPDAANYACLVENVCANGLAGRVLPDRVAIGDRDGEVALHAGSGIGTHHVLAKRAPADAARVQSYTLDTWTAMLGVDLKDVAFIKVDTQGWEARVLAGAARVLAERHIAWQLEFTPRQLERAGSTPAEFLALAAARFTHFIDLSAAVTPRSRPTREIGEALAYVARDRKRFTDLILYNSGAA